MAGEACYIELITSGTKSKSGERRRLGFIGRVPLISYNDDEAVIEHLGFKLTVARSEVYVLPDEVQAAGRRICKLFNVPVPTKAEWGEYMHKKKHCTNCGTKGKNYCTNGRCEKCHNSTCTPGGGTAPGHGYGVPPRFKLDGSKVNDRANKG